MASKAETILANLKTLVSAITISEVAAFAEVTHKLRPPTDAKILPACDIVADTDRQIGRIDGVPEYELTVNLQIVQQQHPDQEVGKRIGDLMQAVRTALWTNPTLTQAACGMQMGNWQWMYPMTNGEPCGVSCDVTWMYLES